MTEDVYNEWRRNTTIGLDGFYHVHIKLIEHSEIIIEYWPAEWILTVQIKQGF